MVICEDYVSFLNIKLNAKLFKENFEKFKEIFQNKVGGKKDSEINFSFPFFEV